LELIRAAAHSRADPQGRALAVATAHRYPLSFRIGAALLATGGVLVLVLLEHATAR
jgi:hypothetical protein